MRLPLYHSEPAVGVGSPAHIHHAREPPDTPQEHHVVPNQHVVGPPPSQPLRVPVTIGICKVCRRVYTPEVRGKDGLTGVSKESRHVFGDLSPLAFIC